MAGAPSAALRDEWARAWPELEVMVLPYPSSGDARSMELVLRAVGALRD